MPCCTAQCLALCLRPTLNAALLDYRYNREPVYNAELGLAIEQLKEGLTIEQLWSVL